jgi:hypothetical protein
VARADSDLTTELLFGLGNSDIPFLQELKYTSHDLSSCVLLRGDKISAPSFVIRKSLHHDVIPNCYERFSSGAILDISGMRFMFLRTYPIMVLARVN